MTVDQNGRLRLLRAGLDGWQTFWFKPQPAYTLGLVRIGFGALVVLWTLGLRPYLYEFFGPNGVMPQRPSRPFTLSVIDLCTSDRQLLLVWAVLLVAAIAMTVGWHTKMMCILVFILVHSFVQGYREAFNGGDALMSIEALVLALSASSCGAALSLDQRRATGSFWSAQCRAPWAVRLLQLQLSLVYLVSVQGKLSGETWLDGTAASYAWKRDVKFALLPAPEWLYDNVLIVNAITWGTLIIELALAILVWNRRCRPWVLWAGVGLHAVIMLTMDVGIFSLAMFVLYLAFVPPETVQRLPKILKQLPARFRSSRKRILNS